MQRSITTGLALQLIYLGTFPCIAHLFAGVNPTKGIGEPELALLRMTKLLPGRISVIGLNTFNYSRGTIKIVIWCKLTRQACNRAIVYLLLSTRLLREEVIQLDLDQVELHTPEALRTARKAKFSRVKGKGKRERTVFLSANARNVLADYL
jgi:site-specific recombinase XerC